MKTLTALLDVQALDNELDQLRYRHEHLPERAEIAELDKQRAALDAAAAKTEASRDALRSQQRQIETDAGDIEAKAASLDARLYDGSVTSPKEATALGEEITSLKGQQSQKEDAAIELLMEIEPLDEQLVQAEAARGEMDAKKAALQQALDADAGDIDGQIEAAIEKRAAAAGELDDELLTHYGKLRITYGPDAVIQFDAGKGGGCPVAMSAVELDRWKHLPAGSMEPCTDCGRLVAKLD